MIKIDTSLNFFDQVVHPPHPPPLPTQYPRNATFCSFLRLPYGTSIYRPTPRPPLPAPSHQSFYWGGECNLNLQKEMVS